MVPQHLKGIKAKRLGGEVRLGRTKNLRQAGYNQLALPSKMRSPGRLIVFEGMDGSGKSALSEALARVLTDQGSAARLVAFPGRIPGTLGQLVYKIHHDSNAYGIDRLAPSSLQALHIAAHLDA